MCALTGLTNAQLKTLIETDIQAEKKLADRIIAKSQAMAAGKGDRERSTRVTKTTRESVQQNRNIDILNLAAGMLSNKKVQRDLMFEPQEYSNAGLSRSNGAQPRRAQCSQSK